jgi:ABC-2 type transport system permease protein
MSPADVLDRDALDRTVATRPLPLAAGRFLRNELRVLFRRRRNQALLVVLTLAPILIGTAVRLSPPGGRGGGGGPGFINEIASNGLFLVFTAIVVSLPVFLPMAVSVVAGDSIAGEASTGTLRGLLTVPVSRTRLLVTKWVAAAVFTCAAVGTVFLAGLLTGAALFPLGRFTLLSGDTVSLADGVFRAFLVGAVVVGSLLGLVTIGVMFSTFTEVPVAAMALTLGFVVVTGVLDTVPQLHTIHPYLITDHWLDFGELLRLHPRAALLAHGVYQQAAYVAIAGSIAWLRFVRGDVTS